MPTIVNADDFGKSDEVNRAICECFALGYIGRTTLMTNMPYADEAVKLAGENGFFDKVGVHLNLTSGEPLTEEIRKNPLFCNEEGCFHAHFHQKTKNRLYMNQAAVQQIREELAAQIERYLAYGLPLKHIDSHHHVHTDLPVLKALVPLIDKYDIQSIRIGRNLFHHESVSNQLYKYYYNNQLKKLGIQLTDYFGSHEDLIKYLRASAMDYTELYQNHSVEIMVHPLYDTCGALVDTNIAIDEAWAKIHKYPF